MHSTDKLQQFLPSLARGVYRFNQQLGTYLQDADAKGFIETKKAFLPRQYRDAIEKLIDIPKDEHTALRNKFSALGNPLNATRIASQFFSAHSYLQDENSSNYLERKFIQLILARIFGAYELLARVEPQYPVDNYRIDFAIFGEKQYAIELDGFAKFKERPDLTGFLNRQNTIVDKGWTLYRFSYADVVENTAATLKRLKDILSKDKELAYIIDGQAQMNLFDFNDDGKLDSCLIVDYFYVIQDYFYKEALSVESPKENVAIREQLGFDFSLAALALSDLYHYLDGIN